MLQEVEAIQVRSQPNLKLQVAISKAVQSVILGPDDLCSSVVLEVTDRKRSLPTVDISKNTKAGNSVLAPPGTRVTSIYSTKETLPHGNACSVKHAVLHSDACTVCTRDVPSSLGSTPSQFTWHFSQTGIQVYCCVFMRVTSNVTFPSTCAQRYRKNLLNNGCGSMHYARCVLVGKLQLAVTHNEVQAECKILYNLYAWRDM